MTTDEPRIEYLLKLERRLIGWRCQFSGDYPNGELIGWEEFPARWKLTRSAAIRWGQRRKAAHTKPEPRYETVVLL